MGWLARLSRAEATDDAAPGNCRRLCDQYFRLGQPSDPIDTGCRPAAAAGGEQAIAATAEHRLSEAPPRADRYGGGNAKRPVISVTEIDHVRRSNFQLA